MKKQFTKTITMSMLFVNALVIDIQAQNVNATGGTVTYLPKITNISMGIYYVNDSQILDDLAGSGDVKVTLGSVDLSTATQKFKIGGNAVLWNNGIQTNIYVGANSGNTSNTGTNTNNIFIGSLTGNSVTSGSNNICIGNSAGTSITTSIWNICIGSCAGASLSNNNGFDNTFVGHDAGHNTNGGTIAGSFGVHNSFFGDESGYKNTTGNYNTAIGAYAMHENLTGISIVCLGFGAGYNNLANDNTFVGSFAGQYSTSGNNNVFLGIKSGLVNTTGHENTFIGAYSDCSVNNLTNASAIGFKAIVNHNDQLILGGDFLDAGSAHHSTFVGIGLSGTLNGGIGPQNSLEINADPARSSTTASGLRFTQVRNLNANNTYTSPQQTYDQTTIQPWGKVLTVDENGDVGLTDDQGGGSLATADNGLTNSTTNIQLGGITGSGTGSLLHDSEIPMENNNLIFSDPYSVGGSQNGNYNSIGIGVNALVIPEAKLHVQRNLSNVLTFLPIGIRVENSDVAWPGPFTNFAVG